MCPRGEIKPTKIYFDSFFHFDYQIMSRTGNNLELKPFSSTTYFSGISLAAFFIFAHIKGKKNMETIISFFSTEIHNNKDGKTTFRQVCNLGRKTVIRGRSLE